MKKMKCKMCGGSCVKLPTNEYECQCCGNVFSDEAQLSGGVSAVKSFSGADLFENNKNGVIEISWDFALGRSMGSGYLISSDGYAITNAHVVMRDDGKSCGVCSAKIANVTVSAKVLCVATKSRSGYCSNKDLALIKLDRVPNGATPLKLCDYNRVRTGEKVFVIGNSLGQGTCITSGIVSDRNRNGQILTDCPINGGNSGGPIFNDEGLVIGTMVASGKCFDGSDAEGMNYAIPAIEVEKFIQNSGYRVIYSKK